MKAYLQLYIEGTRVDLFDDESVNIVQSIQNVKDISRIFIDFTRTFNIPASKTNNKIFEHYYNYSISDGFDARLKKDATIELNSRPFKTGKIKLNGVDLKDGEPNVYRITFFGNTIDLNDLIGDDDLSALDLTAFDTDYDAATVKSALQGGISKTYTRTDSSTLTYPKGIVAPLVTHTTRLFYESSETTEYPNAAGGNLYPFGTNHQGVYFEELKYAIRADAIIKAIEDKYGLTFSTDFFSTTNDAYYGLYLWLHRKKGKAYEEQKVTKQVTGFDIDDGQAISQVISYGDRIEIVNASSALRATLTITAATSITATVTIKKDSKPFVAKELSGTSVSFPNILLGNGTYTVFITSTENSFTLTTNTQWDIERGYDDFDTAEYPLETNYIFNNTREFIISEQIPEIKVIDFLTGIFKMFNLTAYTENGTIIVKTLNEYYNDSDTVWDITNYVDTTESNVDVALPYKEVEFKYEGLETKLAKQHQQLSNLSWATEEYRGDDYYDANPETYQIILPFEHMKYERLYDGSSAFNPQVGWFVDDNSDPYFGKPLLFYAYNQTSATSIRFLITENAASPNVSGTNFSDITQYIIPSNSLDLDSIESEKNINFRNELNEYTNTNSFEDTLFKVYYQDYIAQVFQNDKRLTTIYAYLPIKMLQEFILADTIAIIDRNYTINEIETDFNTGRSKLELINKITVSVGGSDPIETTTTIDEDICTECTADSTFCTVDGTTPTVDKTCDVGRSLVIEGPTTGQTTDDITLEATANNFIGTVSYLWEGGEAEGETTQSVTITNNTTGNVTYTCTATDSDDNEEFADTHIVVWTPKKYTITLNIVNNITGAAAGYNISGNQTGDTLSLEEGQTYSFNTQVTPNSGYEFTTGPTVQNAQGTVGTSNLTVNTTLSGAVQLTTDFITIDGPTQATINTNARLTTTASGFTPTSYQWARSTDGGQTFVDETGETNSYYDANESTEATFTYRVTASDGTVTAQDVHDVFFTDQNLITLTLDVDTSNIVASGYSPVTDGYVLSGSQDGATLTQNAGTVFNFNTTIQLRSGYEWQVGPPTVNNAGGTFTTSQTVTTTFSNSIIRLIVYNYYEVTGCPSQSVALDIRYIRTRDTLTVGNQNTGSYVTIDGNCWYASDNSTAFDWETENGITVGDGEGIGCSTCLDDGTTTDPCLVTKSVFYLRFSTQSDVCENPQSKGFYYVLGANLQPTVSNFCNTTYVYNYSDCTQAAPSGYYALDSSPTERRFFNEGFRVCTTCVDANGLYYLGTGWNPATQYCDDASRVFDYYYFDNNATLMSATTSEYMYSDPSALGTGVYAPTGYYTDGINYRYYDPQENVWLGDGNCPPKPTTDPCDAIPTKPALDVFRRYTECSGDSTIVVGNDSTSGFPAVIEDVSTGVCYSDPQSSLGDQNTPWVLGQSCVNGQPKYDYEGYDACVDCTGVYYYDLKKCTDNTFGYRTGQATTAITLNTNDRVQAGGVDYIVIGTTQSGTSVGNVTDTGETGCPVVEPDDNVFVMERQSDGFAVYVQIDSDFQVGDISLSISTLPNQCFDISGTAFVQTPTDYGIITGTCITTTTTTTTTTVVCGTQQLYYGISAQTACCDTFTTKTVYMNANDISSATVIYQDDTCSAVLSTNRYFTADFTEYYYWNGTTLTGPTTCPDCQQQ